MMPMLLSAALSFAALNRVIALLPVGGVDASQLRKIAPIVGERFAAQVIVSDGIELVATAFNRTRRQYRSTALLDLLAAHKQPRWERLLGVTDVDLYVPELNFVFGEADGGRGVAVFSLARLHADEPLLLRRAATEAVHELGHTYGLGHCTRRDCVMWFSNTLEESDRKGTSFCPAHQAELERAMHRR